MLSVFIRVHFLVSIESYPVIQVQAEEFCIALTPLRMAIDCWYKSATNSLL